MNAEDVTEGVLALYLELSCWGVRFAPVAGVVEALGFTESHSSTAC